MKNFRTFFTTLVCLIALSFSLNAQSVPSSPQFTNDITVEANNLANQRHVKIASSFNGWLFAAYIVNDSVSGKGGVIVRYSQNGGVSWMSFNGYSYKQHSVYTSCDITVAGSDSTHLYLFLADVRKDMVSNHYEVSVSRYNVEHTGVPPTTVFFQKLDTNKVYDIALANDYRYAAAKDSIYSIAMLYSHKGLTMDSLKFADIHKYGKNFGKLRTLATGPFLRNVSLGYTHSQSVNRGAYVAVWEQLTSSGSALGHLYEARTTTNIDSSWTKAICLDSLSPLTNGYVRNPSLACQYNNTDNDSSNVTLAVAFDCARNGVMDSLDVMGYYNKRGDTTNFWNLFTLANTTSNELQANLNFDPVGGNFVATYFDSTNKMLPYLNQTFNMTTPNVWTVVRAGYNDNSVNLKAPYPRVVMNPQSNKAVFSWVMDPSNKNGVVLIDGESLFTGISNNEKGGLKLFNLFPNPANSSAILPVSSDKHVEITVSVYNILGGLVQSAQRIQLVGGAVQNIDLNVASLPSGLYFCRIESEEVSRTVRFVVQH